MKRLLSFLGMLLFWGGVPFWFVYFRVSSRRTRILVVSDSKVLLVKGFLNGSAKWSLPGGGIKRSESALIGGLRELHEETGIVVERSQLKGFGERQNKSILAPYTATFFLLVLDKTPAITLQRYEILEAQWLNIEEALLFKLDDDARFALEQYRTGRA
jgi:ADP-ribose pyrophosphatase YjhB (NUDIX family)